MAKEKTLERATGTAFVLLALYLITTFVNILSTLGFSRLAGSNPMALAGFVFQILAGIAFLLAGVLFWLDSRSSE